MKQQDGKHNQKTGFTPTPILRTNQNTGAGAEYHYSPMGGKITKGKIGVSLRSKRGFTLIELLVVISIIGLLSSVVISSIQTIKEKAQAAKTAREFQEIETAFRLWMDDAGRTEWWDNQEARGYYVMNSPPVPIQDIDGLKKFLPVTPYPSVGDEYQYDNRGSEFTCGDAFPFYGVNIRIEGPLPLEFLESEDEIIDGSDGYNCGKFIYNEDGKGSGSAYYKLGKSESDY